MYIVDVYFSAQGKTAGSSSRNCLKTLQFGTTDKLYQSCEQYLTEAMIILVTPHGASNFTLSVYEIVIETDH